VVNKSIHQSIPRLQSLLNCENIYANNNIHIHHTCIKTKAHTDIQTHKERDYISKAVLLSTKDDSNVEMATKDSDYYIHLVDKSAAVFERIDSIFKVVLCVKYYETASHATEKSFVKRRGNLIVVLFK
jgi:predicted ribosome-associated RNA-binding protein Tma20